MNFNTRTSRVFAYPSPADMVPAKLGYLRKGFIQRSCTNDGLYGLVVDGLDENPLPGDLFLFVNRNRNRAKILLWDGTGLCIFQKRLEQGRFSPQGTLSSAEGGIHLAKLWRDTKKVRLSHSELSLFLEGCELIGAQKLSPDRIVF